MQQWQTKHWTNTKTTIQHGKLHKSGALAQLSHSRTAAWLWENLIPDPDGSQQLSTNLSYLATQQQHTPRCQLWYMPGGHNHQCNSQQSAALCTAEFTASCTRVEVRVQCTSYSSSTRPSDQLGTSIKPPKRRMAFGKHRNSTTRRNRGVTR